MINIKKIQFQNYRQYKNISVEFDNSNENKLHVLRAKNGTGKTTFLNGILWCLYENEHYLTDKDKALPPVNTMMVADSADGTVIPVSVAIQLENEGEIVEFERIQRFTVSTNPLSEIKNAYPGTSELTVTTTPKFTTSTASIKNTHVEEDQVVVQSIVKQYFDEAIYDYYFFDGENLKNYFIQGKSEKIKSSIFNISQVTLLENASKRTKSLSEEKARQAAKIKGGNIDLYDAVSKLEEEIEKLKEENKGIDEELPKLQKIVSDADAALQGYAPVRLNIERRKVVEDELKALEDEQKSVKADKQSFIRKYMTLLNFYPRVLHTLQLINKKQKDGKLPPNIDKEQIKEILDKHVSHCPVCNSTIDEKAIAHLQEVLNKLDVSSATSNFLMEIKSSLEIIVDDCKAFPKNRDELLKKEKYYSEEIAKRDLELKQISAFLSTYSSNGDGNDIDVKKLEKERTIAQDKINKKLTRKALNERDIKDSEEEKESKEKSIKDYEKNRENKSRLNSQVSVLRKLTSGFDAIKNGIMEEIKEDIQRDTWNRFQSMIWKINTFGSLTINDSYEIRVMNKEGHEMTGSLSATEYMALAYSFTLAIHEASGKNCPLVVDSPLGRVSDENRSNMASELLKVSKEKQIIMLFTPDEYSTEVSQVYDGNIASIRDIELSSDETEVAKVGV